MARGAPAHRGALRQVRRPPARRPARRARGPAPTPGLSVARGPGRYDRIGRAYGAHRQEEPRWRAAIHEALGQARRVVNVGAGTGNYEPADRDVVAVEPSATMVAQRRPRSAPAVRGVAEALPFEDGAFDAALAVLTIHHWADPDAGLRELARVATRQVVVTWDPAVSVGFWLHRDYLPELVDFEASLPSLDHALSCLGGASVETLPVPRGCVDGFLGAQWADPGALLIPGVVASMSGLALLPRDVVERGLSQLAADLDDGTFARRNAELAELDTYDAGYRLVTATTARGAG